MKFKCTLCSRSYASNHQLKAHSYSHSEKNYSCDSCTQQFSTKKGWIFHGKSGACRAKNIKPCLICLKKFSSSSGLNRHTKIHMEETLFKCSNCVKESLVIHEFVHTNLKPYTCSLCPETFTRSSGLKGYRKYE